MLPFAIPLRNLYALQEFSQFINCRYIKKNCNKICTHSYTQYQVIK